MVLQRELEDRLLPLPAAVALNFKIEWVRPSPSVENWENHRIPLDISAARNSVHLSPPSSSYPYSSSKTPPIPIDSENTVNMVQGTISTSDKRYRGSSSFATFMIIGRTSPS